MSIPPGQSGGGYQPADHPAPGQYAGGPTPYQPSAPQGTSGLAIAGLVLAFLFAPIGFVLSLIAFFTTGGGKKKGRGLAAGGLVISLVSMGIAGVLYTTVFKNAKTLVDPGCTQGKEVILANADLGGAGDPTATKTKLETLISGLDKAAASARDDEVKAAMSALRDDYRQLLQGLETGQMSSGLIAKVTTDGNKIDELCTIGGAQE